MVISSGMQSMDTMKQVYQIVKPLNPNFCFLQCTSAYPLQPEDANLRVISVSTEWGLTDPAPLRQWGLCCLFIHSAGDWALGVGHFIVSRSSSCVYICRDCVSVQARG